MIIGCHGYLYRHVYLSLYVCHEALCGTVMVHKRDVSFLREGRRVGRGWRGGRGGSGEGREGWREGGEGREGGGKSRRREEIS